jgi:hypothetical protein
MTRLVEVSGAQVFPWVGDERVTVSGYQVQAAFSADLRARSLAHWILADKLQVVA